MAKRKKESITITAEERLKEALVPENKQPYQLPCNWCWVSIKAINQYLGASLNPGDFPDTEFELYSVPSSANNYPEIITGDEIGSSKQIVQEGDVLLCKINPRINRVWIVSRYTKFDLLASSEWIVVRNKIINAKYIMWYFRSPSFREYMMSNVSGVGGSLMRAKPKLVEMYPVPVPPIAEQQRIVDRIESLFSKLDEVEEKLQSVLDSFETRRAAILHKAFTGELTTKWREKNNISLSNWEVCSIDEICKSLKYGTAKKSKESGKVAVIRMGNLQQGEIDWTDLVYSDDDDDIVKYNLVPGDVLFNRTNSAALVGKTSIYRGEQSAIYAGYLIKLDYDRSRILGDYLNYQLNTLEAKEYCNSVKTDGVNQSNINAKKIGAFKLNVAKIEEQREIVRLIDNFMANERHSKELVDTVLKQIESIKRSILSKVFHGELGTNNPEDECAKELIKRILG